MGPLLSRVVIVVLLMVTCGHSMAEGSTAWLGLVVTYQDAPEEGRMTVATVYPESPAAAAGLRVGDVISRVNDVAFRFEDWTATVVVGGPFVWAKPGDHVKMTVLRGANSETYDLVAMALPPAIVEARQKFQLELAARRGPEVFDALARKGTLVQVAKEAQGDAVAAKGEGLSASDAAALSQYLSTSRLRVLFAQLEPGQSVQVRLGVDSRSGETKVELIR